MTQPAAFKYTFPIAKSEVRDGAYYLIGYASGPEVDGDKERMAPDVIKGFADQINASSESKRLPYRDAHAPDGVLRDLGEITRAWINEKMHLGVEVQLDMDNPAARYLWDKIDKGKQYGMSVAGRVLDYVDEFVAEAGGLVRTYKQIVLDEISNTTRPAWYPSFGSVLAKSIKDAEAESAAEIVGSEDTNKSETTDIGENTLDNEELLDETVKGDSESGAAESDTDAEKSASTEADDVEKSEERTLDEATDESNPDPADSSEAEIVAESEDVEAGDPEVEKAGRKISNATAAKLLSLFNEFKSTLEGLELETESSEKSASEDEEETIDKSTEDTAVDELAALRTQVAELATFKTEATARIAELENSPKTVLPRLITDDTKKSIEEEFEDIYKNAPPSERLRLSLAAQTRGR